jgi:hypothetical protein
MSTSRYLAISMKSDCSCGAQELKDYCIYVDISKSISLSIELDNL